MTYKPLIFFIALSLCWVSLPTKAEKTLTSATYSGNFHMLSLSAERKLTRDSESTYTYQQKSDSFLGSILEKSTFRLNNNYQIIPQSYLYRFNIMGKTRLYEIEFNWDKLKALYKKNGTLEKTVNIKPGLLDPLSYQLQLQKDLYNSASNLHYSVLKRGKLKEYKFEVAASEVVDFGGKEKVTIKLQKHPRSKKRDTTVWVSPDDFYQIAQLQHTEKGQSNRIVMESSLVTPEFKEWLAK